MTPIRRVACAVSGGVDSAVAALLLKQQGFKVTGVFMRNWDLANETGHCMADHDREDAQYVCRHLQIPFQEVDFVKEYWTEVFTPMIQDYEYGATPNPDVLCNKFVKFGHCYKFVTSQLETDAFATGHYARNSLGQFLQHSDPQSSAKLLKAVDQVKDQTLFLCQVSQEALRRTMFPLGYLTKDAVKMIAASAGLGKIARKKESMGICFIGSRNFPRFIEEYIEPRPGNFIDIETGKVVGQHKGKHYWTVGQRTLLSGFDVAYFVTEMQHESDDIYVAKGTKHLALFADSLITGPAHWIDKIPAAFMEGMPFHCDFRFQHIHPLISCTATRRDDGGLHLHLSKPLRALTPGQYAVLYHGEECIGSAQIRRIGPSLYDLNSTQPVKAWNFT